MATNFLLAAGTNGFLKLALDAGPFVGVDHLKKQLIRNFGMDGIQTEDPEMFPRPEQLAG